LTRSTLLSSFRSSKMHYDHEHLLPPNTAGANAAIPSALYFRASDAARPSWESLAAAITRHSVVRSALHGAASERPSPRCIFGVVAPALRQWTSSLAMFPAHGHSGVSQCQLPRLTWSRPSARAIPECSDHSSLVERVAATVRLGQPAAIPLLLTL